MAETTSKGKSSQGKIPEEVREHFQAARKEMRAGFRALFPPKVMSHGRKARREMLLAWRSVIDAALKHLDEKDEEA